MNVREARKSLAFVREPQRIPGFFGVSNMHIRISEYSSNINICSQSDLGPSLDLPVRIINELRAAAKILILF